MKNFWFIFIFLIGCGKEADNTAEIISREPWNINAFKKTLFINNVFDTTLTVSSASCEHYGTLVFNKDLSGKFTSTCGGSYSGIWQYENQALNIVFVPPGTTFTGFAFPDGKIKLLTNHQLHLERMYLRNGGINPNTGKEDTLKYIEELILSR